VQSGSSLWGNYSLSVLRSHCGQSQDLWAQHGWSVVWNLWSEGQDFGPSIPSLFAGTITGTLKIVAPYSLFLSVARRSCIQGPAFGPSTTTLFVTSHFIQGQDVPTPFPLTSSCLKTLHSVSSFWARHRYSGHHLFAMGCSSQGHGFGPSIPSLFVTIKYIRIEPLAAVSPVF
jgi:hypothetical protein